MPKHWFSFPFITGEIAKQQMKSFTCDPYNSPTSLLSPSWNPTISCKRCYFTVQLTCIALSLYPVSLCYCLTNEVGQTVPALVPVRNRWQYSPRLHNWGEFNKENLQNAVGQGWGKQRMLKDIWVSISRKPLQPPPPTYLWHRELQPEGRAASKGLWLRSQSFVLTQLRGSWESNCPDFTLFLSSGLLPLTPTGQALMDSRE